ncbi:YceI family protein [Maricaulis sp.]|uniref:YceI family protein n=1 Tax=Maricaulis sp. TaxID=1486257 RepID=UPI002631A108|nr:YceI family protein [Maricaulis sp.]
MFRTLLAAAPAVLLSATAMAEPVNYEFDKTHTVIRASWDHQGYATMSMEFTNYDGTLALDFDEPSNSTVDVTFNIEGGFWVGANQDAFIGHLNSADLFNTEAFPTARFVATGFETEDGVTGTMTGDLTLLGNTGPVSLDVTLNRTGENRNGAVKRGFTATGTILRSQWNMGYAVPFVSDEIEIYIGTELEAVE